MALAIRPDVAYKHFGSVIEAVIEYQEAPPEVNIAALGLFSVMQNCDVQQWSSALKSLPVALHSSLIARLGVTSTR